MDFTLIVIVIVFFLLDKATRPKICKKSVCLFFCITTSRWRTPVNHLTIFQLFTHVTAQSCAGVLEKEV